MAPGSKAQKGRQGTPRAPVGPQTRRNLTPTVDNQSSPPKARIPSSPLAKHVLSADYNDDDEPSPTLASDSQSSFIESLTAHYASLKDPVTPRLFLQLCKDFNTAGLDEQGFYIAVYRLLFSTGATHLMSGFREFLPGLWRDVELGWLDRAIEEDVKKEKEGARERVGGLLGMVELKSEIGGGASTKMVSEVAAGKEEKLEGDEHGTEEGLKAADKIKKRPVRGFRSSLSFRDIENPGEEPVTQDVRKDKKQQNLGSLAPAASNKSATPREHKKTAAGPQLKTNTTPQAKIETKPEPSTSAIDSTSSSKSKKETSNKSASTTPHVGPIYPTIRAILARPTTKPYIHALCGQGFTHPQEIVRHHNGQSGRPGCWEKYGKPKGEQGSWDAHASCKIKLTDIEYVKVEEGYVVVSWGSISEPGIREGEGEVHDGAGGDVVTTAESDGNEGGDAPDVGRPKAKRQKTEEAQDAPTSARGGETATRVAAFGLRARK